MKIVSIFVIILLILSVQTIIAVNKNIENIPSEIIVKFKEDFSKSSIDALNKKNDLIAHEKIFKNTYKFVFPQKIDIKEYNMEFSVAYAEADHLYYTCTNDPNFDNQWALDTIDAPEAWDIETGNEDIVIAVIDTGIDYNHPDLAGNIWNNADEILDNNIDDDGNGYIDDIRGWNFINDDKDPKDDYGHGTHCSGIISAITNNNIGIAGVCWNCTIMPLKGLNNEGAGYCSDLIGAIYYAIDNGANIISMSWGSYSESETLRDALNYAYSQGVVLIAAAGNGNTDSEHYPSSYDNVIAVAATNIDGYKASFSNYGSLVDVAAPGVDIYSTMPTYEVTMNKINYEMNYDYASGTSMACPYVAGVVALLLSKNPDLTPIEITWSILRSTTNISDFNIGLINAYKAMQFSLGPAITNITLVSSNPLDTELGFGWENISCTVIDEGNGINEVKIMMTYPYIAEYQMINLPNTDIYYINTTFTDSGYYKYYIWANDTNGNYNESPFQIFALPPNQDVNQNGQCHFLDLVTVVLKYDEHGPEGWVREDIDNNGHVYFMDLVQIALHYGEYW